MIPIWKLRTLSWMVVAKMTKKELEGDNLLPEVSDDNVVPTTVETFGALSQLSGEQLAEELAKAQAEADRLNGEEKAKDNILALMQLQMDNLLKAVSIKTFLQGLKVWLREILQSQVEYYEHMCVKVRQLNLLTHFHNNLVILST